MKVLITGGATLEPIDDMRFITNHSSGHTAFKLAHYLSQRHVVHLWLGEKSIHAQDDLVTETFTTGQSLQNLLEINTHHHFDLIIHAAAISDYTVASINAHEKVLSNSKIPSLIEELTLTLKPTPKIIDGIKKLFPKTKLIGFKLTSDLQLSEIKQKVDDLFGHSKADGIIQNDLKTRRQGLEEFRFYQTDRSSKKITGIIELTAAIEESVNDSLS